MVDKKITELTELTTPVSADVLAIVDDPAGTPVTKKVTFANIEANITHTNIIAGDGSDHADVATNTTHRGLTDNPHLVSSSAVGLGNVDDVSTDDTAYNSTTWNTNLDSATKNVIRDKIETMDSSISSNTSASHAESHDIASHSDTTATGTELNTLTGGGDTTLHDHDGISENTTHRNDNTQAHSDYLKNDAVDVGVGLSLTGDNSSTDTTYVPNILYNTDATPPTASTVPIGTIYVQYTA